MSWIAQIRLVAVTSAAEYEHVAAAQTVDIPVWVRADEPLATDRRRAERLLDDLRALERGWTDEQLNVIGWRMS